MVLANMVCLRLCEELWFFFFLCLTSYAQKGGRRPVKNKILQVGWRGAGGKERMVDMVCIDRISTKN
jgi:hypothetical protein